MFGGAADYDGSAAVFARAADMGDPVTVWGHPKEAMTTTLGLQIFLDTVFHLP